MTTVGGERIQFIPTKGETHAEQLADCVLQINDFCKLNQIYSGSFIKHTVFVECGEVEFNALNQYITTQLKREFPLPQLVSFIAQAPADQLLIIESTYIDQQKWQSSIFKTENGMCQLLKNSDEKICYGEVHFNSHASTVENSVEAFHFMEILLEKCNLSMSSIVRQWNYIERITEFDNNVQRYQAFNDVRSDFYSDYFNENGYPAATGIGMNAGGVVIEFLAIESPELLSEAITNPRQKDAYSYDDQVLVGNCFKNDRLKTTPKFERARYCKIDGREVIFVSGTASIAGEHSVALNDIEEQLLVTLDNIAILLSENNLKSCSFGKGRKTEIKYARVYLKNNLHFELVKQIVSQQLKSAELLFLRSDICRDELLIEIEAEAVFI